LKRDGTKIVFREQRRKDYLKYGAVSLTMAGCFTLPVFLPEFSWRQLVAMFLPVLFFGICGIVLLRWFFLPGIAVELSPKGIAGSMDISNVDMIPWECISSVSLENRGDQPVIGIQTAHWPPASIWRSCSRVTRRMLWKRHNRRQAPFVLYINRAAAPPEVILHTIQKELARVNGQTFNSREQEEGGTP